MGVARLASADEASLSSDKTHMFAIPNPPRLRIGQDRFVDRGLRLSPSASILRMRGLVSMI
jgi:hypothetical protein